MERLGQRIIKNNFVKQTLPSPGLYGHDYEDFVKQQLEIELPTNQNLVNNVSYTITTHEWKRPLQLGELDFMVLDFSTDQLLTVFEAKSMHDPVYMRRAYTKASKQLSRFIGCLGSLHLIPGMNMCFQFEYEEVDLGNPREWDVHKVQPVIILGPVDKAQQHSKKAKRIGHIHPRTLDNPQDNAA
ncbi:MAG: hypothetical protein OXT67_05705 [Zetaproteobacteria bacterium]|nr:hypothetical protein [Zetaproteobacteria bacterium]